MIGDLETSSITWGDTRLPYAIRRSARRKKTVTVTVDPSGDVLLVAPEHFSTSRLDAVVRRKAAWIVQRLRHVQSHDPDRNGTIRLNWRIIQAPMRLVDCVVVHELVHLRHRGHGRDYWQALGKVMPDYEVAP